MALPTSPSIDFETWLQLEATSSVKHELVGGELYAMAGATYNHNAVAAAFLAALHPAARRDGCRALGSDMAIRAGGNGYYPDIVVTCERPTDDRYVDAPCLIVEVSSPSTIETDRREKREKHCSLPTLQAYVMAAANHPHATTGSSELTGRR